MSANVIVAKFFGGWALHSEIFAVGDIHGCVNELAALIEQLPLGPMSTIVFLGDYVDRGAHSREVIDLIIDLKKRVHVVTLMGNHESMFIEFLRSPQSAAAGRFIFNGGGATLASYGDGDGNYTIPENHSDFLAGLDLFYQNDDFFFVHGGVPEIPLAKINAKKHGAYMLWAREPFLSSAYNWGKVIVHGHTPGREAKISENRIGIDTGCVFNHKLTAIRLPDLAIYEVAKAKHQPTIYLQDRDSLRRSVRFKGAIPIQVFRNGTGIVLETLDYNELGFFARDLSGDRSLRLEVEELIDVKISIGPEQTVAHRGKVVRVKKEKDGIYYAVRFLDDIVGSG